MTENGIKNTNVSDIETLKTLREVSLINSTKKEKRKGICLSCGHTWEGRSTSSKKPPLCSNCGSRDCVWEDSLNHSESAETPVHTSEVSEAIQKIVGSNIQVISNPIEKLGESDSNPPYVVWQNNKGSLSYGVIVNPETLAAAEEIITKDSVETSKESVLSDIEILKAAGYIESENDDIEETKPDDNSDEENYPVDEDENEVESEIYSDDKSIEEKSKSVGFKIPLVPIILVFAVIGGIYFFMMYRSFKRKREDEEREMIENTVNPALSRIRRTGY